MKKEILIETQNKINQINNNNPTKLLNEVIFIVNKLNAHIDDISILEQNQIEDLCKSLTRFTTLPAIPLKKGEWVGRARKIKEDEPLYDNVSKLSYNPDSSKVSLQRMNRKGESFFYCSFGGKVTPDSMVSTILSEVNAEANTSYYVMASRIIETIHCSPIGAFDYYRRGVPHPFQLSNDIKKLYEFYKKNTHKDGMLAIELCDAFLTNVLKKENNPNNNRVYEVTSEIARDCLNSSMDGLLYPSVKFQDYPNLVLKTDTVDNKLSHEFVYNYEVIKKLEYGIYEFKEKKMASVMPSTNGYIGWPTIVKRNSDGLTLSYHSKFNQGIPFSQLFGSKYP